MGNIDKGVSGKYVSKFLFALSGHNHPLSSRPLQNLNPKSFDASSTSQLWFGCIALSCINNFLRYKTRSPKPENSNLTKKFFVLGSLAKLDELFTRSSL